MRWRSIWGWIGAHRLGSAAIAVGLLAALVAAVAYGGLRSTTPASKQEALERFRRRDVSPSPSPSALATASSNFGPTAGPSAAVSIPVLRPPRSTGTTPSSNPTSSPKPCALDCPYRGPPAEGVYTWFQCWRTAGQCTGEAGEAEASETFELIVPVTRPFPRTGVRTVTVSDPNHWSVAHSYAGEHRETFDLSGDGSGIRSSRYSADVSVLGLVTSTEIRQVPAFPAFEFPLMPGRTWSGHWDDPNGNVNANFTTSVVRQEELTIGGQAVQTWLVETHLDLLGPKTHGDADVKAWFAPQFSQSVQEAQEQSIVDARNISYRATWMVTLANLRPQR